jgi:Zn-dependent protease with chaperone function
MIELRLFAPNRVFPEFWELPFRQRAAVLAHEAGHRFHKHLWIQLLFVFDSRAERRRLLHAQEFQADDFAKRLGMGQDLANALRRHPEEESDTHPSTRARVARLIS